MSRSFWLIPLTVTILAPISTDAVFASSDDATHVVAPHSSGKKYAAQLAKLDNPNLEKSYKEADADDRWSYYTDSLKQPFEDFKKTFNVPSDVTLTVDGDSFEAEWFEYVKSDRYASAFSGPDFFCQYFWKDFIVNKMQQSKACMARVAKLKGFKCSISTKQKTPMKLAVNGNVLVLTAHNNHEADSQQYDSGMEDEMPKALPECAKAFSRR